MLDVQSPIGPSRIAMALSTESSGRIPDEPVEAGPVSDPPSPFQLASETSPAPSQEVAETDLLEIPDVISDPFAAPGDEPLDPVSERLDRLEQAIADLEANLADRIVERLQAGSKP